MRVADLGLPILPLLFSRPKRLIISRYWLLLVVGTIQVAAAGILFFVSCGTKAIRDSTFVRLSSEEVGRESSIDIFAIFLLFCSRAFGCEPKPNGVDI